MVTGLLRQSLGYQGAVISDEMSMAAIVDYYGFDDAILLAVQAGVDILLYNENLTTDGSSLARHVVDLIERNVQNGSIAESRIDESYNRIMALKQRSITSVPAETFASVPKEFSLSNYPNPFNPSTTLAIRIPERQYISLRVFDLLGREIAVLLDGDLSAGTHLIPWNANKVSSGVYIAQIRTSQQVMNIKMILMK